MLQRLLVQNYAIIDQLEIAFQPGMQVITGETGAGKSILLGALTLILGQRADFEAVRNPSKKCIVEGTFDVQGRAEIERLLRKQELDVDEELVLRREINPSGKSRSFVNDSPVTLQQLSELGSVLVDLHQQFDTQELGDRDFQLDVLDALADNGSLLERYHKVYASYKAETEMLERLVKAYEEAAAQQDYQRFLLQELQDAQFAAGELEAAESELHLLTHGEELKEQLQGILVQLEESEAPILNQLRSMAALLEKWGSSHGELPGLGQRMNAVYIELKDIADELERIQNQLVYDGDRIQQLTERLDLGNRLLKKHRLNHPAELLELEQTLASGLQHLQQDASQIEALRANQTKLHQQLQAWGLELRKRRDAQLEPLSQEVNKRLTQVGMPNARIQVDRQDGDLSERGLDVVEFLFDANKSGQFQPIRKVASGGELSRLMLCIKSLVASSMDLPTLIFDEIDSGISGEAARQVGRIMKSLAASHQIICITHQPQIAGKADAHFYVFKRDTSEGVLAGIRQLQPDERVEVIARMLSGEKPSEAALTNARELLDQV